MGLLTRTLGGAALVAGVVLTLAVESAYAMPPNDNRGFPDKISNRDITSLGIRLAASRTPSGPDIAPESLALFGMGSTPNDTNDPPLLAPAAGALASASNCPDQASVKAAPTRLDLFYARRTVWYEIRQNMQNATFTDKRLITIDTAGSNFTAALQVFVTNAPTFVPTASPVRLPTNVVACDSPVQTGVPAVVSFIAQPGARYFLEAGVGPQARVPSFPSNASLFLSMRMLDIDPPQVTVRANNAAQDASRVFSYDISRDDLTSGLKSVSALQTHGSRKISLTRLNVPGNACTEARIKKLPGRFCVNSGLQVLVKWLPIRPQGDSGKVTASFKDQAGNIGVNAVQTLLRDITPPRIMGAPRATWTRKGRLHVSARCFGGPGSIRVEVTAGGTPVRAGRRDSFFGRRSMILHRTYSAVHRRTIFVHIICFDKSKNATDRWLFLPR